MEMTKSNTRNPTRKLRVDFVNNLVTFLLSVEADLTYLCHRGRPLPNSLEQLSQTLPSLDHYPSLGEIPRVFYGLLTSMLLVRDDTRFQVFQLQNPSSQEHVLCKRVSMCSHRKLYCVHGIELIGLITAWKPFPKQSCFKYADNNHLVLLDCLMPDPG